ncbi:MAG: hypothetical protein U1G07_14685 [Verrucomicrobiota bacterium]
MPPPIDLAANVFQFVLSPRDPTPRIRGWNRLEGRPRSSDLERSFRAEVRDPLWLLTRQWQFGEFEADNGASPIDARIAYDTTLLDRYGAAHPSVPYLPEVPLEVRAQREPVPFDLLLHLQAAQTFERLLASANLSGRLHDYAAALPLEPSAAVTGLATAETDLLIQAARGHLFDTARLLTMLRDGSHAALVDTFGNLAPGEKPILLTAGADLLHWFDQTYSSPSSDPVTWRPDKLDQAFACAAGSVTLQSTGPGGGAMDWYSFDIQATPPTSPIAPTESTALSFLPVAIQFPGMPCHRYWEMEDSQIDFNKLDPQPNDVPKLLLAEFVLLFANDWCLLPLELPIGSFTRIRGLIVTDVFGDQTLIRPADRGSASDWQRWSMFRLAGDDDPDPGLLLAPSLVATITAPALEEVHFLRDDMANMVWAVEHRVATCLGEPADPALAATPAPLPPSPHAGAVYRLGTWIPSNWRPFVPAHLPGSSRRIRLQRARLPDQPGQPLGVVLNVPAPYYIAEEEVPRAGRMVTRAFRRSRWIDGSVHLWLARSSTIGRGQGSSGLVFDQIEEQPETAPALV